jgi:hypothetical protein
VLGMCDTPGADGWMTDRCLKDEFTLGSVDPRRRDSVGVYDEITYSPICESVESESYIPAACIGRNASGPVGHHHMRCNTSD